MYCKLMRDKTSRMINAAAAAAAADFVVNNDAFISDAPWLLAGIFDWEDMKAQTL